MHSRFGVIRDLVDCSQVNQIYRRLVHDGVCVNGVGGLTWCFGTMLTMAIMAMFMLTFRASLRPIKVVGSKDVKRSGSGGTGRTVIGRDIKRVPKMEDGSTDIVEIVKIRNEDGTITEEITTRNEPALAPPGHHPAADEYDSDYSSEGDEDVPMPQPVPPPALEPIVLEKTSTKSVVNGVTQVTEISMIKNADGTITKKTQVWTK